MRTRIRIGKAGVGRALLVVSLMVLLMGFHQGASAKTAPSPVLDAAFSLLEEGNPILLRYNRLTGSRVQARFKYGVPYFFGGRQLEKVLRVMGPWQESRYYKFNNFYVYGFDCTGLTQWSLRQAGYPVHPKISDLMQFRGLYQDNILPFDSLPLDKIHDQAIAGDLLLQRKPGGYHIMLYAGTLRDYGYREEDLPAPLAAYVDHPLMIHSGENHFYYGRYAQWVKEHIKETRVTLPDGGVMLSVLGKIKPKALSIGLVPGEAGNVVYYFDLEGYPLTVIDPEQAASRLWFRWGMPE